MNDRAKKKELLRRKSKQSRERADKLLAAELRALLQATATDLEQLRPKVTDKETYEKLIAEVEKATRKNESIAQLKKRITQLGSDAVRLGKETVKLLKS